MNKILLGALAGLADLTLFVNTVKTKSQAQWFWDDNSGSSNTFFDQMPYQDQRFNSLFSPNSSQTNLGYQFPASSSITSNPSTTNAPYYGHPYNCKERHEVLMGQIDAKIKELEGTAAANSANAAAASAQMDEEEDLNSDLYARAEANKGMVAGLGDRVDGTENAIADAAARSAAVSDHIGIASTPESEFQSMTTASKVKGVEDDIAAWKQEAADRKQELSDLADRIKANEDAVAAKGPLIGDNEAEIAGLKAQVDMNSDALPGLEARVDANEELLDALGCKKDTNDALIKMNSMNLGTIEGECNMLEPAIQMNSFDLAGYEIGIAQNAFKVGMNMANLAGIAPKAQDNASMAGSLKDAVDMNSDLIAGYDGDIANQSSMIAPFEGRADMNSDEIAALAGKIGKNEDDIAAVGPSVAMNSGAIADNMASLQAIMDNLANNIDPLVKSNSAMIAMAETCVDESASSLAANTAAIPTLQTGLMTQQMALMTAQSGASAAGAGAGAGAGSSSAGVDPVTGFGTPQGSDEIYTQVTPSWKELIRSSVFVGSAVAAETANNPGDRMDYLDALDDIYPANREMTTIIKEFRCYEDNSGAITGFEIDYWNFRFLERRLLPEPSLMPDGVHWKTVGRYGTGARDVTKTLEGSRDNYLSKVKVTTGEGIEQWELETIEGDSVVCGQASPTGTAEEVEGYIQSFDTHWRKSLVGLDVKWIPKALGDFTNIQEEFPIYRPS